MIYVVFVKPQTELDTVRELERKGIKAAAPLHNMLLRKGGQWRELTRLIFPGYVFVDCLLDVGAYYNIKRCSGVIRLLGLPSPLTKWEEESILLLWKDCNCYSHGFVENGVLTISDGILKAFEDKIVSYSKRQKRAVVEIMLGGKPKRITFTCDII